MSAGDYCVFHQANGAFYRQIKVRCHFFILCCVFSVSSCRLKRSSRCGKCEGCLRVDCGKCIYCLDKKKFGGPGRRKKACKHKNCNGLPAKCRKYINLAVLKKKPCSTLVVEAWVAKNWNTDPRVLSPFSSYSYNIKQLCCKSSQCSLSFWTCNHKQVDL